MKRVGCGRNAVWGGCEECLINSHFQSDWNLMLFVALHARSSYRRCCRRGCCRSRSALPAANSERRRARRLLLCTMGTGAARQVSMGAGRAGLLLAALALACVLQSASSGQRFRLNSQEDKIEEAPAEDALVGDAARAAAKSAARRRGESVSAEPGDLDFYRSWFDTSPQEGLVQLGSRSAFGEFPSPTALAVLMRKSIFSLSTTGKVYERFHNQVKWVYVKHENPSDAPLVALTAVRNRGTYFASDSEGRLFQRLRVENGLGWMDVAEDHRIFLGGVPSTEGNVFFISEDGRLLERQFDQMGSNVGGMWSDHGKPDGQIKLVACVDAHTLSYGAVFVIGADGHLYNLETASGKWEDHGLADGAKLAPLVGAALEDLNGACVRLCACVYFPTSVLEAELRFRGLARAAG